VLRGPRTHSGRASVPSGRSVRTVGFFTDGHGRGPHARTSHGRGPRRPYVGLTCLSEVERAFPCVRPLPGRFPGRGGRGRAGAVMAGLAVRESVTLAGRAGGGSRRRGAPGGTGSPATGRPARGHRPLPGLRTARCRRGGPPARCPGQRPGTVSRISRPFIRIREPVTPPHRQLIRVPIRVPADSGAPFQRRTCRTRRE
jgi:hypothetical protein